MNRGILNISFSPRFNLVLARQFTSENLRDLCICIYPRRARFSISRSAGVSNWRNYDRLYPVSRTVACRRAGNSRFTPAVIPVAMVISIKWKFRGKWSGREREIIRARCEAGNLRWNAFISRQEFVIWTFFRERILTLYRGHLFRLAEKKVCKFQITYPSYINILKWKLVHIS